MRSGAHARGSTRSPGARVAGGGGRPAAAMPSAWIELCMGDAATHAEAAAAYERLAEYVAASHAALGLPSADLGELDEEQLALAAEMYESDPAATVKGACSMVKPEPLALGRLVVSLDDKAAPKACANFLALCEGGSKGKASGKQLHYKGVPCHRIVKGFVCQGGDVVNGDGSGGDSIYGKKFNDEKVRLCARLCGFVH